MRKKIQNFKNYYSSINKQYVDIITCIKYGDNDTILLHLENGYIPTMVELDGIIETYYNTFDVECNEELFRYFIDLYKVMTTYADQAHVNQSVVQTVLAETIKKEVITEKDVQYFCKNLNNKELDWGLFYILSVNYYKFELADMIITNNNYMLSDNADECMLREVEACIITNCDDFLTKYLLDGYKPVNEHLLKILETYTQLTDSSSYSQKVFNQFDNMRKLYEINHINNSIEYITPIDID